MSKPYTRKATENDTFILEQIMREAFEASYAHFMPEQYVREFYDNNEAQRVARTSIERTGVAEIMGRVVGFVTTLDNTVQELWVEPNYQGQGVGRALIEWVEEQFRGKGYPTITLYCYAANTEAFEFYKKLRFRKASQFPSQNVSGGPVTVYNMLKMVSKLKG